MIIPPIAINRNQSETLQIQIYEQLRNLILQGALRPGQELPGSRTASKAFGVSRNTVLRVYERLTNEGYLESQKSRKTLVCSRIPDAAIVRDWSGSSSSPPDSNAGSFSGINLPEIRARLSGMPFDTQARPKVDIDLFIGCPDPEFFPTRIWSKLMRRHLSATQNALMNYGDPAGLPSLRKAIAKHLGAARGMSVSADQIIITSGAQEAFNITARLFADIDRSIAIENPCCKGLYNAFAFHGADLIALDVGESGPVLTNISRDALSLICVTPSHQFPTGRTMTLHKRLELLEFAHQNGAYILEHDYDCDFRYDGPPLMSLAGLDNRGIIIYAGTFSKSIGPGLRLGYAVFPENLIDAAKEAKSIYDNGRSWLDQAVLTDFIAEGHYARHLRSIRYRYRKRRDCLINALTQHFGHCELSGTAGGMHLMWLMPSDFPPASEVEARARSIGVGVYLLTDDLGYGISHLFRPSPLSERGLLLGYSAVPEQDICEAIERLASVVGKAASKQDSVTWLKHPDKRQSCHYP